MTSLNNPNKNSNKKAQSNFPNKNFYIKSENTFWMEK